MFELFKKKEAQDASDEILYNPVNGSVMPLEDVQDGVFSMKMLGDGFAVKPEEGQVFSPIQGEVIHVFPTLHAIGLRTKKGTEILVHMGIDTVELEGKPFQVYVKAGDQVTIDTLLASVDLQMILTMGKRTEIIVVNTNKNMQMIWTQTMPMYSNAKTAIATMINPQ